MRCGRGEEAAGMTSSALLDAAGRRRSPAAMPGHHCGRPPRNKGRQYPADPPTVEEIVAVMRTAGDTAHGLRVRALIVVLWRAGLRISEALALAESDLDPVSGAILVRRGKGGKRREIGMDRWGWQQIQPWIEFRPTSARRRVAVRHERTHRRAALVSDGGAQHLAPPVCAGRGAPPLRAAMLSMPCR
jgi:integrase